MVIRPDDNFILIGFMGAGKSTVGRKLAHQSHRRFLDLDREIEKAQHQSIGDIFSRVGENGFRDIETDTLGHVEPGQSLVISCGGGIVVRPQNRVLLAELGHVVWLDADPETLFQRVLRGDNRPLLAVANPREAFDNLLRQREPLYQAVAQIRIDTTALDHDQVVAEVMRRLERSADEEPTPTMGTGGGF